MKLIYRSGVIFLLLTNICLGCELSVRVVEFPPLSFRDQTGQWAGLDIELSQALLKEAGCQANYKELPFRRALLQLRQGQLDMAMNLFATPERNQFLRFIGPARIETISMMVRQESNVSLRSFENFQNLPSQVGIQIGSYNGLAFETRYKEDSEFRRMFKNLANNKKNVQLLKNNHLFGFFTDAYSARHQLQNNPNYNGLKVHPFIIGENFVYFGFSQKSVSAKLFERLRRAFERAKAEGKFRRIIKSYSN